MALRELREEKGYDYVIEMDGSSNRKSFQTDWCSRADISDIVGRSGLFGLDAKISLKLGKSWLRIMRMTGKA